MTSLTSRLAACFPLLLGALAACGSDSKSGSHDGGGSSGGSPAVSDTGGHSGSSGASFPGGSAGSSGGTTGSDSAGGVNGTSGNTGTTGSGGAPSYFIADASPPASCPASDEGNVAAGKDSFVPNTGKTQVSALTYTNVGASGAYDQVVDGWSKATGCVGDTNGNLCNTVYRKPKHVSGSLAPFDDEMSMVFAGPTELYQIAVYAPGQGGWERTAYWDRCVTQGLVFAGNKSWYECAGFVESYVTADGTAKSTTPVQFAGSIAAGTEVNVMSNTLCTDTSPAGCGWSSGLPLHGFKGDAAGSKIFATKFRMPLGTKTPAYWILPSQVIRSSQYGCNCRGQGSDPTYKGGCGEIDVAEILGGVTTSVEATTTLYSFQDITGGGSVAFERPVDETAVFLVIFDAPTSQIALRRVAATDFSFANILSASDVTKLLANTGTVRALK
jgi:hypothetical protein